MKKRLVERQAVARQSSRTETTQLLLSHELCRELRNKRNDETAVFADATTLTVGLDRCQHISFVLRREMTESGLFLTHIFYQEYLKRHYLYFINGSVAQRESKRLKLAMSGVRFPPLPFKESKFDSLQSQSVAVTAELAL